MGHLQDLSSNSSSCFGFSGSKSFSINKDLNLLLLPRFWIWFSSELCFWKFWLFEEFLVLIFADRFSLWALPITAFLLIPPIISAIWLAVLPLPHNSFNFCTFSSVQLIITRYSVYSIFYNYIKILTREIRRQAKLLIY